MKSRAHAIPQKRNKSSATTALSQVLIVHGARFTEGTVGEGRETLNATSKLAVALSRTLLLTGATAQQRFSSGQHRHRTLQCSRHARAAILRMRWLGSRLSSQLRQHVLPNEVSERSSLGLAETPKMPTATATGRAISTTVD